MQHLQKVHILTLKWNKISKKPMLSANSMVINELEKFEQTKA
jgi:hypothetical protein